MPVEKVKREYIFFDSEIVDSCHLEGDVKGIIEYLREKTDKWSNTSVCIESAPSSFGGGSPIITLFYDRPATEEEIEKHKEKEKIKRQDAKTIKRKAQERIDEQALKRVQEVYPHLLKDES